ncbi:MAG: hypothetical protein L3J82_09960 [Planctomycetes bacterium]|nr:hypothetical protein [Planctomycetota bacterium]
MARLQGMEVQFSNADLAALLMQPTQMRQQVNATTAVQRKGLDVEEVTGEAINNMIVDATGLGGKLDMMG